MGFYGKAFDDGLQAKAAGSKPILFPANQNLGRSGLIILRGAFPCARPLSIAHHHVVHIAGLNQFSAFWPLVTQCKVFSVLLTEKMAWYKNCFSVYLIVLVFLPILKQE